MISVVLGFAWLRDESVARIEPTISEVKGACSDDCPTEAPINAQGQVSWIKWYIPYNLDKAPHVSQTALINSTVYTLYVHNIFVV